MKKRKKNARSSNGTSPLRMLEDELLALRRDLRATSRAYLARLEIALAESRAVVAAAGPVEELSSEHLHHIRHLTTLVRDRKVKPEKGRRKDLRKLDGVISDLHAMTNPKPQR